MQQNVRPFEYFLVPILVKFHRVELEQSLQKDKVLVPGLAVTVSDARFKVVSRRPTRVMLSATISLTSH